MKTPTDIPTLEAAVATAEAAHDAKAAQVKTYDEQLTAVKATVAVHVQARVDHDAWRLESATLGREPTVPDAKPAPVAPSRPRPTEEALTSAAATLKAEEDAVVTRRVMAEARKAAEGRFAAAVDAGNAKRAALARLEALLVAVRKAPGAMLDDQVAALGDLGTLRFRALTGKGACIEALVVGEHGATSWENASDGERVLADAHFRDAMRRKLKTTALPLILDRTNLYAPKDGAAWPRFTGPRWLLRSERTESGGIEVTAT